MNDWFSQFLSHPMTPWLGWAIVAVLGIGAATGQVQKRVSEDPLVRLKKSFGVEGTSDHIILTVAAMWITLVAILFIGLVTFLFDIIVEGFPSDEEAKRDFRFLLTKTTALTAVLGGLVALPFTAIRLRLTAEQTRHAADVLFNDKLHEAINDLHTRYQVTTEVGDVWRDDVVRRVGAIDRLEALAMERPSTAARVLNLLASYMRVLSDEMTPEVVPNNCDLSELQTWARRLMPARVDMESAAQAIGRLLQTPEIAALRTKVTLDYVNFQGFNLVGLEFGGTSLTGAHLQGARLEGTNLQNAKMFGARFQGTFIAEAQFQNTDLRHADLRGAQLWDVDLRGARLNKATITEAELWGVRFSHSTEITRAELKGALFVRTDLSPTSIDEELIVQTFADSMTTLPNGMRRPTHWPSTAAEIGKLRDEWRKYLNDPDAYVPPQHRTD